MKKIIAFFIALFLITSFAADKPVPPQNGGTGVNNSSTITVGGNLNTASSFTTSGSNALTLTTTGVTNSTLPIGTATLVPTIGTGATGTWGINISGNAASSTSAGSATDINTTITSTNTNFYLPLALNSSGVQQIFTSSSPLFFNPSTGIMQFTGLKLTGLTGSEAVVSDGIGNLTSLAYTNSNTASTIVSRDSSGNFSAGTITAALIGNASTTSTLQTPRAINGVNFDGSAAITVPAAAGTLTGTTLASNVISSSLTSVGTISSGTWSGSFGAVSGANLISLTPANISAGTAGINISGNAATVTTNANLTGDVTSVGNATTLVNSGISKVIAITTVSGTSQSMSDTALINRYVLNNSSLTTLTLPASPTLGHTFEIVGGGSQKWIIAQNASQFITTSFTGSIVSSTVGIGGNASCSNNTDSIILMYVGSNKFVIVSEQTSGTGVILN